MRAAIHYIAKRALPALFGSLIGVVALGGEDVRKKIWEGILAASQDPVSLLAFGVVLIIIAALWFFTFPRPSVSAQPTYRLKRQFFWRMTDQVPSLRLGQWAALIDGYRKPHLGKDPYGTPWEETFFVIKRNIENGVITPAAAPNNRVNRDTILQRSEIRALYEALGKFPLAIFPERRGQWPTLKMIAVALRLSSAES